MLKLLLVALFFGTGLAIDLDGVWQGYFNNSGDLQSAEELYMINETEFNQDRTEISFTITMVLSPNPSWTFGSGSINVQSRVATLSFDSGVVLAGRLVCFTPKALSPSVQANPSLRSDFLLDADAYAGEDGCAPSPARYPSPRWALQWNNTSVFEKAEQVDRVDVIAMNHLDVGYNGISPQVGFINNIMNKYFHIYFPRAIEIARALEALGGPERLVYTTHPWLVSLYLHCPSHLELANGTVLRCPSPTERAAFTDAVSRGWITWHAGPFNIQPENAADPDLFAEFIDIALGLDDELGQPRKTVLSQRDVPGMTRAVIPALRSRNVTAISVGVNGGSAPPVVGKAF